MSAPGPVPIEVQKQVAAGAPHSATTMKAPSRRARVARVGRAAIAQYPVEYIQGSKLARTGADEGQRSIARCRALRRSYRHRSVVARHSSCVGGKSSAFQEPGPTAHANTAVVASLFEAIAAGSLLVVVPDGQVGDPGHRSRA